MAYTVTFWGTRGSIPTPGAHTARYGGNTPCVAVEGTPAVDAGPSPGHDARLPAHAGGGRPEHGVRDGQRARAGRALQHGPGVAEGVGDVLERRGTPDSRRDVHPRRARGAPRVGPLDVRGGSGARGRRRRETAGA